MPDKDPNMWAEALGYCSAALGAITMWAWKRTHNQLDTKADVSTVDKLVLRVEVAANNQREDNNKLFTEIAKVMDAHTRFVEKAIEELGKRPTREECMESWIRHRSGDER